MQNEGVSYYGSIESKKILNETKKVWGHLMDNYIYIQTQKAIEDCIKNLENNKCVFENKIEKRFRENEKKIKFLSEKINLIDKKLTYLLNLLNIR